MGRRPNENVVPQRGDQPPFTNAVMALVTGVRTLGLSLGAGEDFAGVVAGWDSRARWLSAPRIPAFTCSGRPTLLGAVKSTTFSSTNQSKEKIHEGTIRPIQSEHNPVGAGQCAGLSQRGAVGLRRSAKSGSQAGGLGI